MALALTVPAVGGCAVPGRGPSIDDAVAALASDLSSGTVAEDRFDDPAAAAQYASIIESMADEAPTVDPGEASISDDRGTAPLTWHWEVAGQTWSYQTRVRLEKTTVAEKDAWKATWSPAVVEPSLQPGETLATTTLKAPRGDILGAGGVALVTPRRVLRVGLDKAQIPEGQAPASAAQLAQLVGVDTAAFTRRVQAGGPRQFVEAIVYRREQVPGAVLPSLSTIPGATQISDRLPLAPTKRFAAAILGTVGPATAEIVEKSKGRVQAGDDVGLSGLQARYDDQLSGTKGATVVAVDAEGERRELHTVEPVAGKPLVTTVDPVSQAVAEDVLSGTRSPSALVAIRPSTGELVALASGPGSGGYDTAGYGRYAPGSTFKIVTALALLRAGLSPDSPLTCPPSVSVSGKRFTNYSDYPASALGRISLADALANSCNTAFISARDQITPTALADAAAALGLGVDHDLGFPAYFGQVLAPASETQAAADLIGQGTVLASPMVMAATMASVVHGSVVVPRLLPEHQTTPATPKAPLTADEARQLRALLRGVVERGSARGLRDLPGPPVLAKTGTAEYGEAPDPATHAWMVAAQGDLAVAVFVEVGESGSQTAGPVLERFLRAARG